MIYRSLNTTNSLILGAISVLGFINVADINFKDPYVFGFGVATLGFVGMYISSLHTHIKDLKSDLRSDREYYALEDVKKEMLDRVNKIELCGKDTEKNFM